MTREQRLVTAAFAALAIVVVLALAGRVTATPPSHLAPFSERLFADVPAPLGASYPSATVGVAALTSNVRGEGEGLRGASEHRTGVPLPSASMPVAAVSATPSAPGGDAAPAVGKPADRGAPRLAQYVTWYDDGLGYYAAAGDWHWGDDPYLVVVTRIADGRTYAVTVTVADHCRACEDGSPALDISPAAFRSLGVPLSAGVVRATVSRR